MSCDASDALSLGFSCTLLSILKVVVYITAPMSFCPYFMKERREKRNQFFFPETLILVIGYTIFLLFRMGSGMGIVGRQSVNLWKLSLISRYIGMGTITSFQSLPA